MRFTRVLVPSIALLLSTLPSFAQSPPDSPDQPPPPPPGERGPGGPGPGGPGFGPGGPGGMRPMLEPAKAKAAWTLEAQTASRRAGLDEAQSTKTVELYIAAREEHRAASEEIRSKMREKAEAARDGDGDLREIGQELQKQVGELQKTSREKFTASLTETLGAEKAGKVGASLGTFNPNWDFMVDALVGFNLEAAKLNKALGATEQYVIAADHARASPGDDPGAMRTAMQEARANLADALEPILTPEQMDDFRRNLGPGRGPGGMGGGDRPRGNRNEPE